MISSKVIEVMNPFFEIIRKSKGKTIGQIKTELNIEKEKMKKGASGLIVENLLGIENNNIADADISEIGCEVKVLPLQKNKNGEIKVKEPTQIQMINYFEVAGETWETAKLRKKINLTFWVVYLAKENGTSLNQDDYKIVDYFLDHPDHTKMQTFSNFYTIILFKTRPIFVCVLGYSVSYITDMKLYLSRMLVEMYRLSCKEHNLLIGAVFY